MHLGVPFSTFDANDIQEDSTSVASRVRLNFGHQLLLAKTVCAFVYKEGRVAS